MNKRRLGFFRIHRDFLFHENNTALKVLFSNMIILEARHSFREDCVEYIAISELFEVIDNGVAAPAYEIKFGRHGPNGEHLSISAVRCEPAPVMNFSFRNKIARLKMAIKAFFKP